MKYKKSDILKSNQEIVRFIEYTSSKKGSFTGEFLEILDNEVLEDGYRVGDVINHFKLEYSTGTWTKINGYNTPLYKVINKA